MSVFKNYTYSNNAIMKNRLNKKIAINSFRVTYGYHMKLSLTLFCKSFHWPNKLNRWCLCLHIFLDKKPITCFNKDLT